MKQLFETRAFWYVKRVSKPEVVITKDKYQHQRRSKDVKRSYITRFSSFPMEYYATLHSICVSRLTFHVERTVERWNVPYKEKGK